jgi:hypothetical protein
MGPEAISGVPEACRVHPTPASLSQPIFDTGITAILISILVPAQLGVVSAVA